VTPRLPTAGRAASALVSAVLVVVVLAFVVQSVPALVGAKASYVVLSGSMEPSISPGDVVIVYETDPATLDVGDVVTFARAGETIPVTHRVAEVVTADGQRAFRTKGDANEDADPGLVSPDNVVGVVPSVSLPLVGSVAAVIPLIGYVIEFAKTPVGLAALVVVPLALLLALEARDALRERRGGGDDRADATETTDAPDASADDAHDDASNVAAGDADALADPDALSLAGPDLQYTTVALAAFAAYGVLVAALLREAWAIAVAVALVGLAGMAVGVQRGWFALDADAASPDDSAAGPAVDPIRVTALPAEVVDAPAVEVASEAELTRLALRADTAPFDLPARREYVLFDDGVRYVFGYGDDGPALNDGGRTPEEAAR